MDFQLPETAEAVRKGMRELCADFGTDYWSRCDAEGRWPELLLRGQKVWISGVQRADWMLAVCRTTPATEATGRTQGFSVLLVDVAEASTAGTLRYTPIPQAGNRIVQSNQVWFDDVRVPSERVLGEIEYPIARLHRDARIAKNIPVAEELVLAHIATQGLGLPRSY